MSDPMACRRCLVLALLYAAVPRPSALTARSGSADGGTLDVSEQQERSLAVAGDALSPVVSQRKFDRLEFYAQAFHADRSSWFRPHGSDEPSVVIAGDGVATRGQVAHQGALMAMLVVVLLGFICLGSNDLLNFATLMISGSAGRARLPKSAELPNPEVAAEAMLPAGWRSAGPVPSAPSWSMWGLVGLTSYRFYTGFLSATWLPYLLAMEGGDLWSDSQSLFMGVAKLIYGFTILLNPIFGRIGDRIARQSHGLGRRVFLRFGVVTSSFGIFVCLISAQKQAVFCFLLGVFLWRLGEAMNDVTTEALVPEMVPQSQFPLAASVKAASFLVGGLFGYVLLIVFVDVPYGWLYYAYMLGMLACVVPSLVLLDPLIASPVAPPAQRLEVSETSLLDAYIDPLHYSGGFPRFCLATFLFTLGTSPMFFLLLIMRDVIGVSDPEALQQDFGLSSIIFFLSAAFAAVLLSGSRRAPSARESDEWDALTVAVRRDRWMKLVYVQVVFAVILLLIPCAGVFPSLHTRIWAFYAISAVFGACFGSGYTRFQDAVWQVLPLGASGQANAMGFNTMCRLLGVGLGNFIAGLILDYFRSPIELESPEVLPRMYEFNGYVTMFVCCAFLNLSSAAVTYTMPAHAPRRAG